MNDGPELEPWEKFVPYQEEYRKDFSGPEGEYFKVLFDTLTRVSGIKEYSEQFSLSAPTDFSVVDIGSNPILLRFWEFITEISGSKSVLEIGSFIGLSAMAFARAMGPDGRVVTVEKFDYFGEFAKRNFVDNGYDGQIDLLIGDAFSLIDELEAKGPYDILFIDGNKERYDEYFEVLEETVAPGGLVFVDDCLFHGDALNEVPKSDKGAGVKRMLEIAESLDNYSKVSLPIGNGVLLMRKLG